MKIAVTGSAGFLGRHAVRAALEAGYEVAGIDRRSQSPPLDDPRYQDCVVDLLGPAEPLGPFLEGAGAVVHAAALLEGEPAAVERTNVEGLAAVLGAMDASPSARFVFISSMAVGEPAASAYSRSKQAGEDLVRRSRRDFTILRPAMLYGREDPLWTATLKRKLSRPGPLLLPGGGRTRIQPLYVEDAARAVLSAADVREAAGQTIEIGGPEPVMLRDFLRLARRVLRGKALLVPAPLWIVRLAGRLFGDRFLRAASFYGNDHAVDIRPARQILGFDPRPFEVSVPLAFS
jgi:NADH dehydrogenase